MDMHQMTYKDTLIEAMTMLAQDPKSRFCGYGLLTGKKGNGMKNVADHQIREFTVAENLMLGAAQGMSMAGLKPVVLFERADFLHCAMDAIVNHLDACRFISKGVFKPKVILRVVVGNKEGPLFTGHTHTQDNSAGLRQMVNFPVLNVHTAAEVAAAYEYAYQSPLSVAIYEYKDRYTQ